MANLMIPKRIHPPLRDFNLRNAFANLRQRFCKNKFAMAEQQKVGMQFRGRFNERPVHFFRAAALAENAVKTRRIAVGKIKDGMSAPN